MALFIRRGTRIRTWDFLLPKQARYRAALRPELSVGVGVAFEPGDPPDLIGMRYRAALRPELNKQVGVQCNCK